MAGRCAEGQLSKSRRGGRSAARCACAVALQAPWDGEAREPLAAAHLDAHDRQLRDEGTVAEALLDVVRVDVLARRRDDDVLQAADDLEPALAVEPPEVPRVEPPSASIVRFVASSSV
jgi:hypothetical protein